MPGIVAVLASEAARLEWRNCGLALVELTLALLRLGLDITAALRAAKRRRGELDYDDLIVATRRLLGPRRARPGCSTSSTAASTMCWSTRRRTPTPTSGR